MKPERGLLPGKSISVSTINSSALTVCIEGEEDDLSFFSFVVGLVWFCSEFNFFSSFSFSLSVSVTITTLGKLFSF